MVEKGSQLVGVIVPGPDFEGPDAAPPEDVPQGDPAFVVQTGPGRPDFGIAGVDFEDLAGFRIGERGDAILTSTPVYPALFTAPGHMERDCIRVPLTPEWRWDMEAVKQALTR